MFEVGDVVKMNNTRAQLKTDKWLFGSIIEVKGPRNYAVKIGSERKLVHAGQLFVYFLGLLLSYTNRQNNNHLV